MRHRACRSVTPGTCDPLLIIRTTVQSGTKKLLAANLLSSFLEVKREREECMRWSRTYTRVDRAYTRTCIRRHDLRALETRFLYRRITQKPAINLIHQGPFYPRAYARSRAKIIIAINYRWKSRRFCTTSRSRELASLFRARARRFALDVFNKPRADISSLAL